MKIVDYAVLAVFVIGLIILGFLQNCGMDIYFLLFGFAVALVCTFATVWQNVRSKENETGRTE